jgi:hypothetical protein
MILEDFYSEVLQKLGVLAAEESPSPSDRLAAKTKYEEKHAELSRRDIGVTWFDDEDIPDWIADSFASIVAYPLASKFSVSVERRAQLKFDADAGLTLLIADGQYREAPPTDVEFY